MSLSDKMLIQRLNDDSSSLLVPLRMRKGFDQEAFDRLCVTVRDCAASWKGRDDIPKAAVAVFLDTYPTMVSTSYLYDQAGNQRIQQAAEDLAELIRDCLYD